MTNPSYPVLNQDKPMQDIDRREHDDPRFAKRIVLIDPITGLPYDSNNPLPVDTELILNADNINIGNLKTGSTNQIQGDKFLLTDNNGVVITKDILLQLGQPVNIFSGAMVAPNTAITLVSFTVPTGKIFRFCGGQPTAEEDGYYEFRINNSTFATWRSSGSIRGATIAFLVPPVLGATAVAEIKVTNLFHKTRLFEATLSGYVLDA